MARVVVRVARHFTLAILFVLAAALGAGSGVLFVYASDLPQISALDDYAPSTITRVYASGGEVLGEFATQRRIVIAYDDIAPVLRQAIIAAEDGEFNTHMGVSATRIVVTLVNDIIHRRKRGASTLTQQLTRKLFLSDEKTWERKIKEAILALQIEKRFTKNEIITLYCNQIPWGHGALRRGGGGAALLRQVGQGGEPRGSGDARRHHPGAGAPQSLREHGQRAAPPRLCARSDGR